MTTKSHDRTVYEPQIRQLAAQGMSHRAIARHLGVNRGIVQRTLASAPSSVSAVPSVPADAPADFGEVEDEFDGMVEAARVADSADSWRHVHEVAKTCYSNGYRVRYNPLPLLMKLSEVRSGDVPEDVWQAYSREIKAVYDWMREVKIGNYAHPVYGGDGDRGGVPEFRLEGT